MPEDRSLKTVRGVVAVVPSKEVFFEVIRGIQQEIKADRRAREAFASDPRRYLGDHGISAPLQVEFLRSEMQVPPGGCGCTDANVSSVETCLICTNCSCGTDTGECCCTEFAWPWE
jgi:hypothetical protein